MIPFRLLLILPLVGLLSGCVLTAVGVAAGATVAIAKTAVTVPIKAGGAAIDAVTDDDEEEEED